MHAGTRLRLGRVMLNVRHLLRLRIGGNLPNDISEEYCRFEKGDRALPMILLVCMKLWPKTASSVAAHTAVAHRLWAANSSSSSKVSDFGSNCAFKTESEGLSGNGSLHSRPFLATTSQRCCYQSRAVCYLTVSKPFCETEFMAFSFLLCHPLFDDANSAAKRERGDPCSSR